MELTGTQNAVVLVIDRLGANMLGAYGNTWFDTDNFNRLAARSIVFEQAISASPSLTEAYHTLWQTSGQDLFSFVGQQGTESVLMTDEPNLEQSSVAAGFDRIIPIRQRQSSDSAERVDETESANFFAQLTQFVSSMADGTLAWFHSRGLSGAWDAPYSMRERLADSEDPDPPAFFHPPSMPFTAGVDDPDVLLGYQQACAAQVMLIDDFLGVILELMDSDPRWKSTLFCLMATRGYPLGEHHWVGDPMLAGPETSAGATKLGHRAVLHDESLHVPLMICLPDRPEFNDSRAVRNASLMQPDCGFLKNWFSGSMDSIQRHWQATAYSMPVPEQEAICTTNGDAQMIQTRAWKLIREGDETSLFVKPDDRWEVNDVASRCPAIVDQLVALLDCWESEGMIDVPKDLQLEEELYMPMS